MSVSSISAAPFLRIFQTRRCLSAAIATIAQFNSAAIAIVVVATVEFLNISVLLFQPLL